MTTLHAANSYNVLYTLHEWLRDTINGYEKPAWLPTFSVVEGVPEQEAALPAVSLFDLPGTQSSPYQGRNAEPGVNVMKAYGMLEASCWVSRNARWNGAECWRMQLNTLAAWVQDAIGRNPVLTVKDALADYNNPVATGFVIHITAANAVQAAADLNPDVMRQRILIPYWWHTKTER